MASDKKIIEVINVSKGYQTGRAFVDVLKNVSLEVREGDFLAIEGPSGSGKTTLLNLLGGLDGPDKGEILVEGENINEFSEKKMSEYCSCKIGIVFQFFNLMPYLTALENVLLPKMFSSGIKKEDEKRARDILFKVGVEGLWNSKPVQMSGGEQQRVAIARALIGNPKVLILDEPTGNLDSQNSQDIFQLLKSINRDEKTTMIIGTHDLFAKKFANEILKLESGEIKKVDFYEN